MKYMLLIYQNPANWQELSEAERTKVGQEATAIFQELTDSGQWIGEMASRSRNTRDLASST